MLNGHTDPTFVHIYIHTYTKKQPTAYHFHMLLSNMCPKQMYPLNWEYMPNIQ